jgi:hypothetical protein
MSRVIMGGVVAGLLAVTAQAAAAQSTAAVRAARTMFQSGASATMTATELHRAHGQALTEAVAAMKSAGYAAAPVAGAAKAVYAATATPIFNALRQAGYPTNTIPGAMGQVGIALDCFSDQGEPVPCASFGGVYDTPAMGQVAWSPKGGGFVDSLLTITASALPPVDVRLGSATLAHVSYTAQRIVVRLPSSPTSGPLTLRRQSDRVEGRLETNYQVTKPVIYFSWNAIVSAASAAAAQEAKAWLDGAYLTGCTVQGALANAPAGSFRSSAPFQNRISAAMKEAGASALMADAWQSAVRTAWDQWANGVTVSGHPWYPGFAAYPAANAPPTINVPSPLGSLLSIGTPSLGVTALAARIETLTYGTNPVPDQDKVAIGQFAALFAARFAAIQAALVVNVKGSGPVPSVASGGAVAGPVVNGTCGGTNVLGTNVVF